LVSKAWSRNSGLCCPAFTLPRICIVLQITYQEALAAVFIEGWIFILISLTGVRGRLVSLVPKSIMLATAGGIGLFLAL
jgi:xanthine/uracil/vitamin C permease (AzgA family)